MREDHTLNKGLNESGRVFPACVWETGDKEELFVTVTVLLPSKTKR